MAQQYITRIYTQKHEVLQSADGDFVVPDGVQKYDLCSPIGEAYSVSCNGISQTFTENTASEVNTRSFGTAAITITTTGTLYIILYY